MQRACTPLTTVGIMAPKLLRPAPKHDGGGQIPACSTTGETDNLGEIVKKVSATFVVLILSACALGQSITGFQPFGTFQNQGPDSVNLADLNVHLSIPIVSKKGIGLPFTASIEYDSSLYAQWSGASANMTHLAVTAGGWVNATQVGSCGTNGNGKYSASGYYDADQTYHPFLAPVVFGNGGTCVASKTTTTVDGSGITVNLSADVNDGITLTATYPSGVVASGIGTNPVVATRTLTDTNSNAISGGAGGALPAWGTWTDTLGLQVLSASFTNSGSLPYSNNFVYSTASSTATISANFSAHALQTAFGCSGHSEFTGAIGLLDSISLPDGSSYTFTYEATPGFPNDTTGRLASVTLPTGGTITYTYPGANGGINCTDGTTMQLTRQTSDGTWTYSRSGNTTTLTAPSGDYTAYTFSGPSTQITKTYETGKTVYTSGGSALLTSSTCYNGNTTSCATAAITLPITQRDVYTTLAGMTNPSQVETTYDSTYGTLLTEKQFDFGATTAAINRAITYGSWNGSSCVAVSGSINDRPCSDVVTNVSGGVVSTTHNSYDAAGNLLSIQALVGGTGYLTKSFTYNANGTVATATDINGAQTTYAYNGSGGCNNGFVTSMTAVATNLTTHATWDCNGGVQTSSTDANGQVSHIDYVGDGADPFWRPETSTDPAGVVATFDYTPTSAQSATTFNSGASTGTKKTFLDGLGRPKLGQVRQSPTATNWDSTSTRYDSNGRPLSTSMPCSAASGTSCPTSPSTTQTYDGANRPLVTTDGGGGTVTRSYLDNDMLVAIGPAPAGEGTKQKQYQYDGLGRVKSVCEVSSASGSGSCGQSVSKNGFLTKYTYATMGYLLTTTQNAQSASSQTRTFTYDDLGRMKSEAHPESGTTQYFWDSAPSTPGVACPGTYKGDLVKKYDANGNTTCYAYDSLHRVTSITYSGPNFDGNNKYFVYDSAVVNGATMQNTKGRLAEAYTAATQNGTKVSDLGFSYSARGELIDLYESTPHSGGYYHTTAGYWDNGAIELLSGIPGQTAWNYGVDGEGRPFTAAQGTTNLVTNTTFNAASQPVAVSLGLGESASYQYDPNTGRMTNYTFTVGSPGTSMAGTLTWNTNGTLSKLAITDGFNAGGTQTCKYGDPSASIPGYDDMGRLITVDCGASIWQQNFLYDPFGNLSKSVPTGGTGINWLPGYDTTTNRYTLGGTSYDADGNLLNDTFHTYSWNQDNLPHTIDSSACGTNGTCLTYDALGRVVEENASGSFTQILYSPVGKTAIMSGQTMQSAYLPLPGGQTLFATPSAQHFWYNDWLGSVRLASSFSSRTADFDRGFAPFGETYQNFGATTNNSFGGNTQDISPGLYDTPKREMHPTQGRWLTPDPGGMKAFDLGNPQSLNRYAYVMGHPVSAVDPSGLCPEPGCSGRSAEGDLVPSTSCDPGQHDCSGLLDWGYVSPDLIGTGFLQNEGTVPCPNNQCKIIGKNGPMFFAVTENGPGNYYSYSGPGSLHGDFTADAIAAAKWGKQDVGNQPLEPVGNLYEDQNGLFTFDLTSYAPCDPNGTYCEGRVDPYATPEGYYLVGFWHDHPIGGWLGGSSEADRSTADFWGIPFITGADRYVLIYAPHNGCFNGDAVLSGGYRPGSCHYTYDVH